MKTLFLKKALLSFSLCGMLLVQSLTSVHAAAITPSEGTTGTETTDKDYPPTEVPDDAISVPPDSETADSALPGAGTDSEKTDSASSAINTDTEKTDSSSKPFADSETLNSQSPDLAMDSELTDTEEIMELSDEIRYDGEDRIEDGYRIRVITPGECPSTEVAIKDSPTSAGITQTLPDLTSLLRTYLNEARTQATDTLPTKIIVEPGAYVQHTVLRIYSNTYLYLDGVTLINVTSPNMLVTGMPSQYAGGDKQSGYCYRNITIDGGSTGCTWNKNYRDLSTTIKVGHTENFTMKNCTLTNTLNAHFMEVSGVNHFTLQKCSFKNQILEKNAKTMTYEAVQFDVLVPGHIGGFDYELLKTQNITIDGCTFSNVARGVGSHNTILNFPLEHIAITNCTFDTLTSSAIQGMDWRSCTISGNYMINVPRGITLHSMRDDGVYLPSTIAANGGTPSTVPDTYLAPDLNQNIVITNNTISCSGTDAYVPDYDCSGILLWGMISNGTGKYTTDPLPAGDYYISGATVTGNKITAASGIVLRDVYNTTVSGNTLTCPFQTGDAHYGIFTQRGCKNLTFSGNTIQYFPTAGIFCQVGENYRIENNSLQPQGDGIVFQWITNGSITGNTINNWGVGNPGNGGIRIQYDSTVPAIDNNQIYNYIGTAALVTDRASVVSLCRNTIEGCRYYGIYLANASVSKIEENILTNCGSSSDTESYAAITIALGGKVTSVKKNTVSSSRQAGIQVVQGEAAAIDSNTITSPSKYGIEIKSGTAGSINSNTIKSAGNYSIVVYTKASDDRKASVGQIKKNKITSGKAIGINISSTDTDLTVDANTVKSCKDAQIYINRNKDLKAVTVSNNIITGTSKTQEGIRIDSGSVILSKNTIKSCRYAVLFTDTKEVKGSVYPNTFSKNKYNSIRYDGISYKNLSAPTSVKATNAGAKQIQLKWKASKKISGYVISRSKKKKTGYKQVGTVSYKNTSYVNKKLKKNTKYYYTVTAYRKTTDGNIFFYSDASKVVARKTPK